MFPQHFHEHQPRVLWTYSEKVKQFIKIALFIILKKYQYKSKTQFSLIYVNETPAKGLFLKKGQAPHLKAE